MIRAYAVQYRDLGKWNTQETYKCGECAHEHAEALADGLTPYRVLERRVDERLVWGHCPGHASTQPGGGA